MSRPRFSGSRAARRNAGGASGVVVMSLISGAQAASHSAKTGMSFFMGHLI